MHNPFGISMSKERRTELVRIAAKIGITIVEDLVYGFLTDAPPICMLAPDRCIVVDSLSKRVAPGLAVGYLHVPEALRDRVWSTVRGGAWTVPPMALSVAIRLMQDGSIPEIVALKRKEARRRQAIMAELLAPHTIKADPASYHLWLELPGGWRSEAFAAAAARAGVAVTPSSAFAMTPGHAPPAVRLALGLPPHDALRIAATRLSILLKRRPGDNDVTE
jgi:DNA-binding transcriptional MocR family regulator